MRILKFREVEVVILICHQILVTNLQGNDLKLGGELTIRSWELKGSAVNLWKMSELINCLQISISLFFFFALFTFVTSVSYNFFFNNSQALRGANVQGTQNVLLFACTSKIKPLHYIRYVSFLTSCLNHYSMLWETHSSTYCAKLSQGVVFFVARMLFFRMDCPTVLKMQIWCNMHRNLRMGELLHYSSL